jgi:hypothetical protein
MIATGDPRRGYTSKGLIGGDIWATLEVKAQHGELASMNLRYSERAQIQGATRGPIANRLTFK